MNLFNFLSRYFWLIAIIFSFLNMIPPKTLKPKIQTDPEFANEYSRLKRKFLSWMNIPWLVMGFGILFGGIPSVWHFFRPQDGNPFVLAFYLSIFLTEVVFIYWVFIGDGAQKVIEYQLFSVNFFGRSVEMNKTRVRLFAALSIVGSIAAVVLMIVMDTPVPPVAS